MKTRFTFYFIALVALVLTLAATPSHATERRDPVIPQEPVGGSSHVMSPAQTMWESRHQEKTQVRSTNSTRSAHRHAQAKKPPVNHNSVDLQMGSNSAAK